MKIIRTLGIGLIGGLAAVCTTSCKKDFKQAEKVGVLEKMHLYSYNIRSECLLKDSAYICYGKDTIKMTQDFVANPSKYVETLNELAVKKTPKKRVSTHIIMKTSPTSEGGSARVPTIKNEYIYEYKDQIGVIKSDKLFTSGDEDLYVPVEYYGKPNNL